MAIQIPSQALESNLNILVRALHKNINRKQLNEKPHRHEWQEIIYIASGKGKHRIDEHVIELKENSFYIIGKGQIHDFLEGKDLNGYLIRFMDDLVPRDIDFAKLSNSFFLFGNAWYVNELHISKAETKAFESLLSLLSAEVAKAQNNNELEVVIHLLMALMAKLSRLAKANIVRKSSLKDIGSNEFQEFLILLEEYYNTEHDMGFYTAKINTNIRRLRRIVKSKTGLSPKQLLTQKLMQEARRMLHYSNKSFKEIALELGYDDPAYFSRHFKLIHSKSPKRYQQESVSSPKN